MDHKDVDKRMAALVSEHARLMSKGFPEKETTQYLAKIAELPENHQEEIKRLTDLSETLKSALKNRDYYSR